MDQEAEFRAWLEVGGAQTEAGRNSRVHAVKTIERKLRELGSPCADLTEAWALDRFTQLRERIRVMRQNARSNGQDYRILMPNSDNPLNRLSSWNSWLAQYGRFLGGESRGTDADRIRQHVLERYIEPARESGTDSVDVLVRDVNAGLGLNRAWPNICQALGGPKFQDLAQVAPPERIGADMSSAAIYRFNLSADPPTFDSKDAPEPMTPPTNLILYGPPGTGKTYHTAAEAVRLCGEPVPIDREALMETYQTLAEAGRIEFVTFHQSISYEDFVEGLRPTQSGEGNAGFELKPEQGVFRRIARRAETSTGPGVAGFSIEGRQVFKMSIGEAAVAEDAHLFEEAIDKGYTLLGYEDIDWSDKRFEKYEEIIKAVHALGMPAEHEPTTQHSRVQAPFYFRNMMKPGDLVVVSKGNLLFRAIGEVTGAYQFAPREGGGYAHRRAVRWLWVDRAGVSVSEIYPLKFTMKTIYLLNPVELNVRALERYVTSQQHAGEGAPEAFVLIIDEINRANISKVFGELITLLEPDKRLGMPGELKVRLPYSSELFGVPANLHVVGTMNTADRSIALLDTALRRRFEFRELMPDASLLTVVDGVDLGGLLTALNTRIEYLFDREHQIGHAYFIGCTSLAEINGVMRHRVIPLLAEYFHEDWAKVAAVLGDGAEGEGDRSGGFIDRRQLATPPGMGGDGEAVPRYRWIVRDAFDYGRILGQ